MDWIRSRAALAFRPLRRLRIDNTILFSQLSEISSGESVFDDWIARSRWNWQFDTTWSLRTIVQWESTHVNEDLTSLEERRNLSYDFLLTYRTNPWTALFVGYNANARNVTLIQDASGASVVPTDDLHSTGRQFLIKVSYLFR